MTKYILVGGYIRKAADGGKAFCEELIRGFAEPVKILDCFFAIEEVEWAAKLAADKEMLSAFLPNTKWEIRTADPNNFAEQVKWADAIFLRGGRTDQLVKTLGENPGWSDYLEGKTLAGTSAGMDAISKYYYDIEELRLSEGLGLVDIKALVHYQSDYNAPNVDWDKAYSELESYKEDLPILALHEGEFRVIEQ